MPGYQSGAPTVPTTGFKAGQCIELGHSNYNVQYKCKVFGKYFESDLNYGIAMQCNALMVKSQTWILIIFTTMFIIMISCAFQN